ncbi:hypothetical protein [Fibrella forsythiae]|uniref:Uncharacterized protein n=1 Tax=Fibrella forsythiae TaxID=2817061 RepID=A0ABS3JJX1_9BACT|nr:hypothetical protein [Fibrella forsythiae]MBO0950292.1 hypothetical protein [Fibrella forsythiae]
MKQLATLFFLLCSPALLAQTFSGHWQGAIASVQNPQQEYPASMNLRVAGSQLTGSVTAQVPIGTETYRVNAQITGTQAAGMVTDAAAGTSMNVELALTNGKLVVAFGLNNVPVIMGVFTQQGGAGKAAPQAGNVPSQQRAAPVASAKRPTSGIAAKVDDLVRGRRLLYLKTGNGLAQKWFYDLCSNGTYLYSDDTSYSSYGGGSDFSAYTRDGGSGTWRVGLEGNVVYLELRPNNGQPSVYELTSGVQGEINLQGRRYFLTTNQSCR